MMTMSSLHQKLRTGGSGSSSTSANGSGGVGPGWCALNEGGGPANCTPGGAENAYHLSHFIILPVKMPSFYQDRLGTKMEGKSTQKREWRSFSYSTQGVSAGHAADRLSLLSLGAL